MNNNPLGEGDFTPEVGSQTDIAPLGRNAPPPEHELSAKDVSGEQWHAIAATPEFRDLIKAKFRFILPCTIFFFVYYLALPVLVGYMPELMAKKVWGEVNIAYLFALSQFPMVWILAGAYVYVAAGWDRKAAAIISRVKGGGSSI